MKRLCQQNLFSSEVPYSLELYNVNLHLCPSDNGIVCACKYMGANVDLGLQRSKTETNTRKKVD